MNRLTAFFGTPPPTVGVEISATRIAAATRKADLARAIFQREFGFALPPGLHLGEG